MRLALEIVFWLAAGLIVWTQLGYALALAAIARLFAPRSRPARTAPSPSRPPISDRPNPRSPDRGAAAPPTAPPPLPAVSLIVAAHDEQASIAAKVRNALALHYPRELLEVIVACDGCADATAAQARAAGADLVLELPRGGKIRAQDAAVARARGELVAFSDANAMWEPPALTALVAAFAEPRVAYASGQARFTRAAPAVDTKPRAADRGDQSAADRRGQPAADHKGPRAAGQAGPATNQEGLYWRYELAVRALESRLSSITAGNGAIYAVRRDSYINVDPIMGHDLSFPFNIVKRRRRAVYVPGARAHEPMVPSIEGELARKRRMMSHTWPIVLRGGMLSPRGYPPGYALMILSHRLLRYATPFLHLLALTANVALVAMQARRGGPWASGPSTVYTVTLALQLALLAAAALARILPARPLLIARYYVLTTAAIALGLFDWLRHGTPAGWDAAEGTRPPLSPPPRGAAEGTP